MQQNVSIILYWRSLINCRDKVDLTILVSCSLTLLHLFNSPDSYEMFHKTVMALNIEDGTRLYFDMELCLTIVFQLYTGDN